jgi:hypothetical protein
VAAVFGVSGDARSLDAVPDCEKGNLKADYLGKECKVGNLAFKFDRDFGGGGQVNAAAIEVSPVADPPGLEFTLPVVTPPAGEPVTVSFLSAVRAAFGGKNVTLRVFVSRLPREDERDFTILELTNRLEWRLNPVDRVTGSFAKPLPEAVRVVYNVTVYEEAQPNFTLRFASRARDGQGGDSSPEAAAHLGSRCSAD